MSSRQDSGCFDESPASNTREKGWHYPAKEMKGGDGSEPHAKSILAPSRNSKNNKSDLQKEVDGIRGSLDSLTSNLLVQQNVLAREFEDRIRHVYDDVINDINSIRKCINSIGDTFDHDTKFKTWAPVMPFRKEILPNAYDIKSIRSNAAKLKGSKSVDFVDQRGRDSFEPFESDTFSKYQSKTTFCKRRSWLSSSRLSVNSISGSRKTVPGFGHCFSGDGKTIPYRSYSALPITQRNNRHSWGPSRSGSRSALDEDEDGGRGCLSGVVTDDWRAKVAPYMWDGCPVPGLDRSDIGRLRERYEQIENMRHDVVKTHNEYRQLHGCPDLIVSTDLATDAQQWSDILATKGYAQYSDVESRGENILVVDIADTLTGRQVADTWYRESKYYNYKRHRWQRGTSNFTQMIWKSSKFVGVGISKFPYHDTYIIVVQYQPPGNINTPKEFQRNVPVCISTGAPKNMPQSGDELSECDDVFDTTITEPVIDFGSEDIDDNALTRSCRSINEERSCEVIDESNNIQDEVCQTENKTNERLSVVSNDQLLPVDQNFSDRISEQDENDDDVNSFRNESVATNSNESVSNDVLKDEDREKTL